MGSCTSSRPASAICAANNVNSSTCSFCLAPLEVGFPSLYLPRAPSQRALPSPPPSHPPRLGWALSGGVWMPVPQDLSQAIPFRPILSLGGSVLGGWALQSLLASIPPDKHFSGAS